MAFVSGMLTGANTPGDGNYSYQDVTIHPPNVTSIQISSLTGRRARRASSRPQRVNARALNASMSSPLLRSQPVRE